MRRFKGNIELIFIIALALLLFLSIVVAKSMHRASLLSYDERIDLAIILDNAGSGLLGLLNSGETQAKHMETLGASVAKVAGTDFDKGIRESLENLKTGMKQMGYSLKVMVSGEEAKSYGEEPPEGATRVETDTPMPCRGNGDCRGRVRIGIW